MDLNSNTKDVFLALSLIYRSFCCFPVVIFNLKKETSSFRQHAFHPKLQRKIALLSFLHVFWPFLVPFVTALFNGCLRPISHTEDGPWNWSETFVVTNYGLATH